MADIFDSSRRTIARAKQHIADLDKRVSAFNETKPYAHVVEPDTAGNHLHKVKMTSRIPEDFSDIASDAVNNLRASLDQAGYSIAVALGKVEPRNAYFPFADSAANLESIIKRRCKDLPNEILALFRSFKPYKGGDDLLWTLNRICNTNKHRLLAPIGIGASGMHVRHLSGSGNFSIPVPKWDSGKNEIVFLVVGADTEVKYDLNISFGVSFNEIDTVQGLPTIGVLNAMADSVSVIFERIRAKAFKMGLLS